MQSCDTLVLDNIAILRQGIELTSCLGPLYSRSTPRCLQGSIGGHFRHCIDFYNNFLSSVGSGRINYDLRARNELVESDPELAALELQAIIAGLRRFSFADGHAELLVALEGSTRTHDCPCWTRSSIARELQSLLSHTVHHYALIAIALRLQGIEPSTEFGVAPSTLEHWRKTA
ncbi:MAG TPA: DinB family protein [Blastocatellia bacterium]|nr:DinB family protein [Blastocatellia bacterium]